MVKNAAHGFMSEALVKLMVKNLDIRYANVKALMNISQQVHEKEIFGIIGPANAGKTSCLKCLNRMDDFDSNMWVTGEILFNGRNVRELNNVYALRRRIGVVFPLPVGLPLTVYENVALAPRLRGINQKKELDIIVERCLQRAALWDEVKDRLDSLGSLLSGGQQQRLTIARAPKPTSKDDLGEPEPWVQWTQEVRRTPGREAGPDHRHKDVYKRVPCSIE